MIKKKKKSIKKQKKQNYKDKLCSLQNSINNYSKLIPLYDIFNDKKNIDTSSFYDMIVYKSNIIDKNNYTYDIDNLEIPKKIYKCIKISLKPTEEQSKILLDMLEGYRLIYNLSISFIKKRYLSCGIYKFIKINLYIMLFIDLKIPYILIFYLIN